VLFLIDSVTTIMNVGTVLLPRTYRIDLER